MEEIFPLTLPKLYSKGPLESKKNVAYNDSL